MIGSEAPETRPGFAARLWARRVAAILIVILLALLLLLILLWQTTLPARLFEDWTWYRDGADRLLSGQQLYDPVYLHGAYDQRDPAVMGKFNQWPALAVALVPLEIVVPEFAREPVWGLTMLVMLVLAFAIVWPRRDIQPLTSTALALIVALLPATWLAFRTANFASAVALGVALTIYGRSHRSDWLAALGLLLAGMAKLLPAAPLVVWLIVRHRGWRPVALALLAGGALSAVAVVLQGPSILTDFVLASAGQLPLAEWTNVAPAYLLAPVLGSLALPLSLLVALAITAFALRPSLSDGASLLLLTTASCLVLPTTHVFWWLSPMVAAICFYGTRLAGLLGRLFDWQVHPATPTHGGQSVGANLT